MQHPRRARSLFPSLPLMILLVALPGASTADYMPPPIYDLLGASELIVLGSISKVGIATFQLDVEEVLLGSIGTQSLTIEKFEDWVCSTRWQPYEVGQRVVAFLERDGERYKLRSAGSEGEFPVFGQNVYVHGYAINGMDFVDKAGLRGYELPLDVLSSVVGELSDCFELKVIEGRWRRVESIEKICDGARLERYRSQSALHASVVKTITRAAVLLEERNRHRACQSSLEPFLAAKAVALIRDRGHVVLDNWHHPIEVTELSVEPDGPFETVRLNDHHLLRPTVTYLPSEDGTLENLGWLLGCGNGHLPNLVPPPFSKVVGGSPGDPPRKAPQVLGLAEIPGLFGDYRGLPDEPKELQLFAEPTFDSATVRWITSADELVSSPLAGEIRGALVREKQERWIRLSTKADGEGWIFTDGAATFKSLQWLSKWRQMIVTEDWDGLLYDAPEITAERQQMSPLWRDYLVDYSQAVEIKVTASQWFGPTLWFQVEVMSASACSGPGYPEVMARGWIPAHNPEGEPAVWFRPKSC